MKKKTLLFVSIAASTLLVGGTFAAWAVTDNAAPFGIKINPDGTTISDTDTKTVVLNWGTTNQLTAIGNLAAGQVIGPKEVDLKAKTQDGTDYTGLLEVSLIDQTVGKGNGEKKLIDYLDVYVTKEKLPEKNGLDIDIVYDSATVAYAYDALADEKQVLHVPPTAQDYSESASVTVTGTDADVPVYFYITLNSSVNNVIYQQIKSDVVYLQVDWNKAAADSTVTSSTIYWQKTLEAGHKAYVYAWNESVNPAKQNHEWPGVEMANAGANLYSYSLASDMNKIIFVDVDGSGAVVSQTDDIAITDAIRTTTPYYNGTDWVASIANITGNYYLRGTFNNWEVVEDYKLTADNTKDGYTYSIKGVSVAANAELKVYTINDQSVETWYAAQSTENTAPNMTINDAGVYNFYFNPAGNNGIYILCEAAA